MTCVNKVDTMMTIEDKVDLCLVCCSKVKTKKDPLKLDKNSDLLCSNLIVFYLLRKVLQVSGIEIKNSLVNCGSPVEWIKLCDKCNELTRQALDLHQKLLRIERELNCVHQLIRDKTINSIKSETDRKLAEETIDLTEKSIKVWRRIRNHVANKCNSTKNVGTTATNSFTSPFSEGDKLANYLITRKLFTAILPNECTQTEEEDNELGKILEENNQEFNLSSLSPLKIKIEGTPPPLDVLEESQLADEDTLDHHQNYENGLIDNLLGELNDVKNEETFEEVMEEVDSDGGEHQAVEEIQVDSDKEDWNWEPDDEEDDNQDEKLNDETEEEDDEKEEYLEEKGHERCTSAPEQEKDKVKGPPSSSNDKIRSRSTYIKKGTSKKVIRTEDGKFKCRHCDQTFARHSGLNGHEREKHSKTPGAFKCDLCERTFNSRDYLRKHTNRTHKLTADGTRQVKTPKMLKTEDGKYKCIHCDQIFQSSSGCTSHQRDKHSRTPGAFICDLCGRAFNSQDFLRSHKRISHKVKPDGTPIPPKKLEISLERNHMCDLCGKGFGIPRLLKKHIRFVHEKKFNFSCKLCGLGFTNTNSLKKHQLAVHPEDPSTKKLIEEEGLNLWKCPVIGCKMKFLTETSVKGHLKSLHGRDDGTIEGLDLSAGACAGAVVLEDPCLKATCQTCGKTFENKYRLKSHEKMHENKGKEKEFICEICGGGFVSQVYLKGHVDRVHLKKGVKRGMDFKCDICGKGYSQRYLLKVHLEIHEKGGKRDYFCDKCGHGFVTEGHLRKHKRVTNCGVEGKVARVYNRKGE